MTGKRASTLLDIGAFVACAGLFGALFWFSAIEPSAALVAGAIGWGAFFAYAILLDVRRGGQAGYWAYPMLLHVVIMLAIAALGIIGLVHGNAIETASPESIGVIALGIAAILAINMFRLVSLLTEKLRQVMGLTK